MNNEKGQVVIIAVVAIALIAAGFYFFGNFGNSSANVVSSDTGNSAEISDATSSDSPLAITRDELATHNSETDCWIAYKGKVYDITSWLTEHPGGVNAILQNCGTAEQFEQAFTKKHGTKMVPLLMQVGKMMGDFDYQGNLQN